MTKEKDILNPCGHRNSERIEALMKFPSVCPACLLERIKKIEAQLEQHRWIPVSERLPEKTEEDLRPEVLVYDGESVTGALWRHYSFRWDFETDRGKPTHWKPIILP